MVNMNGQMGPVTKVNIAKAIDTEEENSSSPMEQRTRVISTMTRCRGTAYTLRPIPRNTLASSSTIIDMGRAT